MNDFTTAIIVVSAISVAVLVVVWLVHSMSVSGCRKELAAYKQQVVKLSDGVDTLQERHKLLPHSHGAFKVPMTGETLAAYQHIGERLVQHRTEWLKLMEVWEQAQALLESEWFLGNSRSRSARKQLRAAGAPTALTSLQADCEAPLLRIEQAHAQAEIEFKSYQQDDRQLGLQLESIAAAALAVTPYQPERAAAVSLVEQAQSLLPGDPLGTLRGLAEARGKVAEVTNRALRILEHVATNNAMLKNLTEIERLAIQRRSQGFLLREEGVNPDPILAMVRQQHASVLDALQQANDNVAGTLLSTSGTMLDQIRQAIERHVAAKARCESELPTRQAESRRLADVQALARGQHAELARDFATELWLGVAENVQRAQASLNAADQYTSEAARQSMSTVQNFLQAAKLLDQAGEHHKHAQTELAAVGNRLRELIELRARFQAQVGQVGNRAEQVRQLLASSNADRALANERFRGAQMAFERLVQECRQPRPDWNRLGARLQEIATDLDRVEKLAREDIQLAQQAAAEVAETERVIRDARAYHESGISVDVAAAESQLAQARGCLMSQGFEEAIRLANLAEQSARTAHQDAVARAQRLQQELESQRRAEEAAARSGLMQCEAEPT